MFEIGPVVLEKKLKIGNVYRWTDGQTDDGLQAIRKAHLSFQLMWAKNVKSLQTDGRKDWRMDGQQAIRKAKQPEKSKLATDR